MNFSKLKKVAPIFASLAVAAWIFWYLYKDIAFDRLITQIVESSWLWIACSLAISLLGFWIRGWRWTLVIQTDDNQFISPNRAFHAVMIGYLVNLLVPRAGELARCGVLARTNDLSIGHLFGTVLLERTIDLLFLMVTIGIAFLIENQHFKNLAFLLVDLDALTTTASANLPIFLGGLVVFLLLVFFLVKKYKNHGLIRKSQQFFREIGSGIKSIRKISNPWGFWISSILIWFIYFLTMLTISLGIPSTANLSAGEILLVMVMGSIGMVAPVQGGIGTFHALVAFILMEFGISEEDGKIFAAIIHGTQVLLILVVGFISWVILLKIPTWKKPSME